MHRRPRHLLLRRLGCAAVAVVALVAPSACGSADQAAQSNSARTAPVIAITATLALTSPVKLGAQFTDTISDAATADTCAAAAKGFGQDGVRYVPPHNGQDAKLPGPDGHDHAVTISFHVAGYHGPATYQNGDVVGDDVPQLVTLDGVVYAVANGGTITVTVNADDSGKVLFGGLTLAPSPTLEPGATPTATPARPTQAPTSVPPFSGTLTWTCVQVRAPRATAAPAPTPKPGG